MPTAKIVMLSPGDWQRLKRIRVLSVGDSPDAFGTTLDEVHAQADAHWKELAEGFVGDLQALFVAIDGESPVGATYTRIGEGVYGHIGSMWVAPTHRRQGLGLQLLNVGIDWLKDRGVSVARLWVTEGNGPATMLYEANGFSFTGAREMLREGSNLERVQMEKRLGA